MQNRPWISPQVAAGVFLTFCLGLFFAFIYLYGRMTRHWRGRTELRVVFTQVSGLQSDSRVLYNGLEVGRVREVDILALTDANLAHLPAFTDQDLGNLPLTDDERETLRGVAPDQFDREVRRTVAGRSMVLLTLDVLGEGDAKRYRRDDRVRISTTMMGECSVQIFAGSGPPLRQEEPCLLLGATSDTYGNLAQSLDQLQNMLSAVGEMIGGSAASPMSQQVGNFDQFTARMEKQAETLQARLPGAFDRIDARLDRGRESLAGMVKRIAELRPDVEKSLGNARERVEKLRADAAEPLKELQANVQNWRRRARETLANLAKTVADQKTAPAQRIREAREWTERVRGRVETIETEMTSYDRKMAQDIEILRDGVRGIVALADGLEEKLWYLAERPDAALKAPGGPEGRALDLTWRKALAERHFRELRPEVRRAVDTFKPRDASDEARMQNLRRIMEDLEAYFAPAPPAEKPKRKGGR